MCENEPSLAVEGNQPSTCVEITTKRTKILIITPYLSRNMAEEASWFEYLYVGYLVVFSVLCLGLGILERFILVIVEVIFGIASVQLNRTKILPD